MPQNITVGDRRFNVWSEDNGYAVYPKTPDRNPLFFGNDWTVEEISDAISGYLEDGWPDEQRRKISDAVYEGVDEDERL